MKGRWPHSNWVKNLCHGPMWTSSDQSIWQSLHFPSKWHFVKKNHNVLHISFQGDSGGGIVVVDSKTKPQTYMLLAVLSQNRLGKHKSNLKNFHCICVLQNTLPSFKKSPHLYLHAVTIYFLLFQILPFYVWVTLMVEISPPQQESMYLSTSPGSCGCQFIICKKNLLSSSFS